MVFGRQWDRFNIYLFDHQSSPKLVDRIKKYANRQINSEFGTNIGFNEYLHMLCRHGNRLYKTYKWYVQPVKRSKFNLFDHNMTFYTVSNTVP